MKSASLRVASAQGRPVLCLPSSQIRKEDLARARASKEQLKEGLVCVLTCLAPCRSFQLYRNRETKRTALRTHQTQCLHRWHDYLDPRFGRLHARLQTWFPFNLQLGLNGREGWARKMDDAGMRDARQGNTFVWSDAPLRAQPLANPQLTLTWERERNRIADWVNPALHALLAPFRAAYYGSHYPREWATELMFRDPASLAQS